MRHFYGYCVAPDDPAIAEIGAERVWIDHNSLRTERANMLHSRALREGDTLVVFYLRHLGGSPPADEKWRRLIEDRGVTIEIFDFDAPPKPMGRPKSYDPSPAAFRRHRTIWLDGTRSEADRLRIISADHGAEVTRGICHKRFGNPTTPKPIPSDMAKQEV